MTVTDLAGTARSEPAAVHGRVYRRGILSDETVSLEGLADVVRARGTAVWLDLVAPTPETLGRLAEVLDLHPLAVEDALAEPRRPKLDRYPGHQFVAVYRPRFDQGSGELDPAELSVFVSARALVTVRQRPDALDPGELARRWDEHADLAGHGVSFLLHGLLDLVVDEWSTTVRRLADAVEDLEDALFDEDGAIGRGGRVVQRRAYELRKSLTRARRLAQPTGDLLVDLGRPGVDVITEGMAPYYGDVRDHAIRAAERLEGLREMVGSVLDTQLALRGDQLNEIMKKLTSWAAIIAVPTAVTGFYGQNVPYPGFQEWSGFVASISSTLVIAALLYILFRRRGWL